MARSFTQPQKAFFLAMALALALAFTPSRWLGWTKDIAGVVNVPFTPFGDAGRSLRVWLRPPSVDRSGATTQTERRLLEERDMFERLYRAEQLRVAELTEHVEQLQQAPVHGGSAPILPMIANITRSHPRSGTASVEINRGSRDGVIEGTVAVYRYAGEHLIGRVTEVSRVTSRLTPITAMPDLRAIVLPRDMPGASIDAAPRVMLTPRPDGTFTGSIEHLHPVAQGDVVRLHDPAWPASASAMLIGYVESVARSDSQPLNNVIAIRPRLHVDELASVTLLVERDEPERPGAGINGRAR